MSEIAFQKQVLSRLANVEKTMNCVMKYITDLKLSEDDKKSIKLALKEEKEGKLLTKKQVFG